MGKKGRKYKRSKRDEKFFASLTEVHQDFDIELDRQSAKTKSKIGQKLRRKLLKEEKSREKELKQPVVKEQGGFHLVKAFAKDPKMERDFLITSFRGFIDMPFCPLGFFKETDSVSFYFESDYEVAQSIRGLSKRIQSPSGELMQINVTFCRETDFILNCEQIEIVKAVMIRRYNSSCWLLDLSCFHLDEQLVASHVFAPLSNNKILKQVFSIIKENIPTLCALDLSNNKLTSCSLKCMKILDSCCSSLSAINLEKNNFADFTELVSLTHLPLRELKIRGHDPSRSSVPRAKYMKAVKKCLPFLKMLDGQDLLQLRTNFNRDILKPFPSSQPGCTASVGDSTTSSYAVTEDRLKVFLEQYYSLVDSTDKESLLQAYVPTAKIELKSENLLIPSRTFEGQLQIQEFLHSWPSSRHDHSTFNLEVINLSPEGGLTQVTGACFFQESDTRFIFRRTMKIIPYNSGFCCCSDVLEIQ